MNKQLRNNLRDILHKDKWVSFEEVMQLKNIEII